MSVSIKDQSFYPTIYKCHYSDDLVYFLFCGCRRDLSPSNRDSNLQGCRRPAKSCPSRCSPNRVEAFLPRSVNPESEVFVRDIKYFRSKVGNGYCCLLLLFENLYSTVNCLLFLYIQRRMDGTPKSTPRL